MFFGTSEAQTNGIYEFFLPLVAKTTVFTVVQNVPP